MADSASLGVLLDHAQDKVVLVDETGEVTYANEAVRRILGYEPAELVGVDAFAYIHPEDVDRARATFERTLAAAEFVENTVEYRFRAADGSWVWLESQMSNLTDEELDGYVVSSRDISDRVAAEAEREAAATRLQELAATTGDVLWMFDGDWSEVLFVNPAYEDVYGGDVDALTADPSAFLDTVHPDDRPAVKAAMERLSGGESVDMEYRVNPEADYGAWVWVQAEPIVEDGEVVRITGFTRDITDRRRRERQLYVMDNLLRHNLRNDLSVIMGNAQLIEEAHPDAAAETAVIRRTGEQLLETADKERRIIDLLTSTADRGRVDLSKLLADSVAAVRERFPDATVTYSCPGDPVVDAVEELGCAVVELLENALRHGDVTAPRARVAVTREEGTVVVAVRDEGPAIPEIESRVLTGNYEMNDVYHSSGLGLWLVYWVVELSDGRVAVDAGDDGNCVRLFLEPASD